MKTLPFGFSSTQWHTDFLHWFIKSSCRSCGIVLNLLQPPLSFRMYRYNKRSYLICLHCVVGSKIESFAYMLHTHTYLVSTTSAIFVLEIEVKSRLISCKRKRCAHDVVWFYSTLHSNFVRDCTMFHIASLPRTIYDGEITSSNSKQKKNTTNRHRNRTIQARKFYNQNTIFFIQFSRRKNERN